MKRVARTRLPRSVPLGQYRRTLMAVRRFRLNFVFGMLLLLYGLLLGRLGQLQIVDAEMYRDKWLSRQNSRITLDARRGRIVDRHGHVLAEPKPCVGLAIDPGLAIIRDPAQFAFGVAALLKGEVSAAEIVQRIQAVRDDAAAEGRSVPRYVRLVRRVDDALLVERLWEFSALSDREKIESGLWGLIVEPIEGRWYPNRTEAAHVLGRVPMAGVPGQGLEAALDAQLRGEEVSGTTARDGRGNRLARGDAVDPEATRGEDAVLTLDLVIQHHLELAMDRMVKAHISLEACGLVLDVRSGEVLAMASRPTFDPNREAPNLNRVTQGLYEPGSCFKPFTVAFALTDGVVGSSDIIPMPAQVTLEGDPHPVHDDHYIGDGMVRELLAHSSNTGSAWLAHLVGRERMGLWLRHLFPYAWSAPDPQGDRRLRAGTGIGLPWEKGYCRPFGQERLTWVDTHRAGFGQGFAVTPLQIACAFAALARDDGRIVRPRLVRGAQPLVQDGPLVCHPRHLPAIREGLEACVTEGTASRAFKGCRWSAAGKTATSQSSQRADERVAALRGLVPGEPIKTNLCTFVAYAPAREPQVLVLVLARQLKEDEVYGGSVAGPAVRSVLEATLAYWDVAPDRTGDADADWLAREELR
jgi:cell division protein FtsI/penicillin-binding protein 2